MVTVTNMILTKILLAYHISRTAPRRQGCANPAFPRTDPDGPEHWALQTHLRATRDAVFIWNKGFMPKLGKTAFVVFLNYSKNKTSR